MRRGEICEACQ